MICGKSSFPLKTVKTSALISGSKISILETQHHYLTISPLNKVTNMSLHPEFPGIFTYFSCFFKLTTNHQNIIKNLSDGNN